MNQSLKNIDTELLLKQKEDLFAAVLDTNHKIDPETLEGVINLLDAVQDSLENPEEDSLSKCEDCGYIGNAGKWTGSVYFEDDTQKEVEDIVYLCDETFDLDPLFEKDEHIDKEAITSFDGEADCPICGSKNLY